MPPQLSIIVPYYNHPEGLPRLLDSIGSQSIKSIETIIVDDCSDRSCRDIVEAFVGQGLSIRIVECNSRQYTKNARLLGVEAASAPVIAFADADDILWETEHLEYHLAMMLRERADIVHFNMYNIGASDNGHVVNAWARPFADQLEGQEIFRKYVTENMRGHNVYTKLFSRSLCMSCLEDVRGSGVRRYMEDFCLSSYFLFHAQKYLGSDKIGYARKVRDTTQIKAPGRAIAVAYLLQEFVPHITRHGCSLDIVRQCSLCLQSKLYRWVRVSYAATEGKSSDDLAVSFQELLLHGDETIALKTFLAGHPYMQKKQIEQLNKEQRRLIGLELKRIFSLAVACYGTLQSFFGSSKGK